MRKATGWMVLGATVLLVAGNLHAAVLSNFWVDARAQWVDTGIDVTTDHWLSLTASGLASGANGVPPCDPPEGPGWGAADSSYLAPGLQRYSLVGKIGGTTFQMASVYEGPAVANGRLYFAYNDERAAYGDNNGGYTINGTIELPEPATLLLVMSGLAWAVALRRR